MAKKEIDEAFMIIEKPNNFVKTANTNIDCSELSKAQTGRLNFTSTIIRNSLISYIRYLKKYRMN